MAGVGAKAITDARVGIVIVTHNSKEHLPRLKAAVEAQTARDFALVLLDNASHPDQRPTVEELPAGARLIQSEENLGFAAGNNRAAALLATPYVALLNPDAFPEPGWLAALLAAAERHPKAGAFGSTQISAAEPGKFDGVGDCYHAFGLPWRGGYGAKIHPISDGETFSACAAAALYRREAWLAAGGFDERYFCYVEDVDLGFRLRLLGWRCVQVADAIVAHVGGASSGKRSSFSLYYGARNRLWTFVKDMPAALLWPMAPFHVALTLLLLAIAVARGEIKPTLHGVIDGLRGLPAMWATRRSVQRSRVASLTALAQALAWSPLAAARRAPVVRPLRD
jgi:N-acetylglucosaminyl-diphospho-decaprenol L-rhamnosyltransferase